MTTTLDTAPANAVTGQAYTGQNVLRLLIAADEHGWEGAGANWAGYGQWQTVGRQVAKDEHGTEGIRVCRVVDKATGRERTVPKRFKVFHFAQTVPADTAPAE